MPTDTNLAVVILAAGQGKRMQDPTKPKVLYELADKPLVGHVLDLAKRLGAGRIITIVGFGREKVISYINDSYKGVEFAIQSEQLGTGHAVRQTQGLLDFYSGDVLILYGDVPLTSEATLKSMLATHYKSGAKATVLSTMIDNPTGYGRIVRSSDGKHLEKIVEEKDADDQIRRIREINSGICIIDSEELFRALTEVTPNNSQKEYYLTDVFTILIARHGKQAVALEVAPDPIEVTGVNTKEQLQELETEYFTRQKN